MVEEEVTPKEVAKRLGVSLRTIYDLIDSGRLKATARPSLMGNRKYWLIPISEVEKLEKIRKGSIMQRMAGRANRSE